MDFDIIVRLINKHAGVAELADALDSGSSGRKAVQVQVLLPAPKKKDTRECVLFSCGFSTRA